MFLYPLFFVSRLTFFRLLDYASTYFDLSTFSDGETKRALQRVVNKRANKVSRTEGNGDVRDAKKRKKN